MRSLEKGSLSIAVSETALRVFLLKTLEKFRDAYSHVHLMIHNCPTSRALSALRSGLGDFAIVTGPITLGKTFHQEVVYTFHDILIGGTHYKEAVKKIHHLSDLEGYPLIGIERGSYTYGFYMHYFLKEHLKYHLDIESATTDQILPMVIYNMSLGLYPKESIHEEAFGNTLYQMSLEGTPINREIYLIYDEQRPQSIAVKTFLEFIRHAQ